MPFTGSAEIDATVGRVAPDVLELLAGRHDADDVALTLVRLAVTGDVEQVGGRYTPGTGEAQPS